MTPLESRTLILAADTSGKNGSIALAECSQENCKIIEVVPLAGGTFSAQLVPQIASLLAKHGHTKANIGAFAVASGPGSFTGMRVGLAAIKALAEVLQEPIATVSLLEVLACSANVQGRLLAALDAGRNEVYVGEFDVQHSVIRSQGERLISREECLQSGSDRTLITPDAALAQKARALGLRVEEVQTPRSDRIAQIGWRKIQVGETVSPEELDANYIRRSDAEIFAKK
ncbi:MAG TPA: tRNA (adenosine(37)-N6)-threonylcarbamoyltransferase complex dimerization subunit type 1 TsaB [Terriglobales bacterium]|nr:tRNA (adenosine(37)-N6)-threonylcarbamoyltransferase complex dimerization subunit type 1 TsaB [Terriglobales bacterium]